MVMVRVDDVPRVIGAPQLMSNPKCSANHEFTELQGCTDGGLK